MKKHVSIQVKGRVQGVFFRASTQSKARSLGLHGIVRNEPDGSVYLEAEGEEEALTALTEWCRHGPPQATVTAVITRDGSLKNYTDFTVMH